MTQLKRWERDFQLERLSRLHLFDEYIEMSKYNKHKDSKKIRTLIMLLIFTYFLLLLKSINIIFQSHSVWICYNVCCCVSSGTVAGSAKQHF